MSSIFVAGIFIFVVAVAMTMVGKGGGNFYVVILTVSGVPMHEAATTGQFILFSASVAAMVVFQKNKSVSWMLAVIIGTITALSALGGGYFFPFVQWLFVEIDICRHVAGHGNIDAGACFGMYRANPGKKHFGIVGIGSGGDIYEINLWIVLPITVLTGFCSGMVGVSQEVPFWFR